MEKGKKASGGRYKKSRKKKKHELGRQARFSKLGKTKIKKIRTRGGNEKVVSLTSDIVNLVNEKGKIEKVKIKNVLETPSNRFFARRNILMKGSIIETEKGKARITNRPGQEGNVQAVLISEKEK